VCQNLPTLTCESESDLAPGLVTSARGGLNRRLARLGVMSPAIALIAHDGKKPDLVAFAMYNRSTLARWDLVATQSTGRL